MTTSPATTDTLLDSLGTSSDVELTVVQLRLLSAAKVDERLPFAVRASAVSRDVDPELLGVLLDEPDQVVTRELLDDMVGQGLADETGGVYRFHDVVREALLREWHSAPERQAEFEVLNRRLVDHYLTRLREVSLLDADFARVSVAVRSANPRRWARIKGVLDGRISWAVRRAARHGFAISAEDGMSVLRDNLDQLIAVNRLTVVDRLLTEARDLLAALPDSAEVAEHRAVVRYFFAGLKRRVSGTAGDDLAGVAQDPNLPARYRLWALDELASAHEAALRLADARNLRIELAAQPTEVDEYNAPLWAYSLGRLQWKMLERSSAIEAMRHSLDLARGEGGRQDLVIWSLTALSRLHQDLGHQREAAAAAIEAVDQARTGTDVDRATASLAAYTLANLIVSLDARASEAVWAEAVSLLPDLASERVDVLDDRADYLSAAGATRRMRQVIAEVEKLVEEGAEYDDQPGEIALRRGYHAELEGGYVAALQHYDEAVRLIDDPTGSTDRGVDALLGRARARRRTGDLDGAEADLDVVTKRLRDAGWNRRAGALETEYAQVALGRGRLEECANHLAASEAALEEGNTWDRCYLLRTTGAWHLARGEWEFADRAYEQALRRHDQREDIVLAVEALGRLALSAEERADWPRHNVWVRRLSRRLAGIAARAGALPSSTASEAARAGGQAMELLLYPTAVDEPTAVMTGRSDLERARRLDPQCFWYPFNLSYLHAAEGDSAEARRLLEKALSLAPAGLRVPLLHRRVLEYALDEAAAGWMRDTDGSGAGADVAGVAAEFLTVAEGHLKYLAAPQRRPFAAAGVVLAALAERSDAVLTMASAMGRIVPAAETEAASAIASLNAVIPDPLTYWRVRDLLDRLATEAPQLADNLAAVGRELNGWLTDWFGLDTDTAEPADPPVTVMRLELGADLVPFVDDQQDGGHFLMELVPELRRRVALDTGVEPPMLRSRSEPSLGPTEFRVLVDQVPVLTASLDLGHPAMVEPYDHRRHRPGQIMARHPLDGRSGGWAVVGIPAYGADFEPLPDPDPLPPELALLAMLELAARRHLESFVDADDTRARVARWQADPALADQVPPTLGDSHAEQILTSALRALATEGVPLVDDAVLAGLNEVGGPSAGVRAVVEAIRRHTRDGLPGTEPGRLVVELPADLAQDALRPESEAERATAMLDLSVWVQEATRESGEWLTVVVPDHLDRLRLAELLHAEHPLLAVLSAHES